MDVAFPTQLCSLSLSVVWLLSLAGCGSCPAALGCFDGGHDPPPG